MAVPKAATEDLRVDMVDLSSMEVVLVDRVVSRVTTLLRLR